MAKPFLKWAGGKTQLLDDIDDIIGDIRVNMDSFIYVEPFVGGGSVLLHLLDTCSNMKYAIINDLNSELINCYRVVADNELYPMFKDELYKIQDEYNSSGDKKFFYEDVRCKYNAWMRSRKNNSIDVMGAVYFIFLNKCGFNGLYRVSKKSGYNVHWGQKEYLKIVDFDNLDHVHVLLNEKVVFMEGDYTNTSIVKDFCRVDTQDVLFYLDPPCRSASFTNSTTVAFTDKSQENLKLFCDDITSFGGYFLLSNSCEGDYIENLYKDYNIKVVKAKRNINSDGTKRGDVDEVLITNYDITNERESYKLF